MPTVRVAKDAGFCFGVKRAREQVEQALASAGGQPVKTFGPLMHNKQEVDRLAEAGVRVVMSEDEVGRGDHVVVRCHGVTRDQLRRLRDRAGAVTDATCPHVLSCQSIAARMSSAGYGVILVGDEDHPETRSISSHARGEGQVMVVGDPADLEVAPLNKVRRVAVLAQTTMSRQRYQAVVAACLDLFVEVRAFNTICEASRRRQQEAQSLASEADMVVVVGSRESANCCRLADLCKAIQPRTLHVETASEIHPAQVEGAGRVAITAGASTPDWVLRKVAARLEEILEG